MANKKTDPFRGDTWTKTWRFPVGTDLSGSSARMQLRDEKDTLILSASTQDDTLTIALNTELNRYELFLRLPIPQIVEPKRYFYDVEFTDSNGNVKTYISNDVYIKRDVTHD